MYIIYIKNLYQCTIYILNYPDSLFLIPNLIILLYDKKERKDKRDDKRIK